MNYRFHPEAFQEYLEAARHYAAHDPALSRRFLQATEAAVASILDDPRRWPLLSDGIRRCLTRTFPYAILYTIEPESILILAVMHCSREPGYWKSRQ